MMVANKKFLKAFYLLIVTMLLLLWLEQRSINAYWIQTYHRNSPLAVFDYSDVWRKGGDIASFLNSHLDVIQNEMKDVNEEIVIGFNDKLFESLEHYFDGGVKYKLLLDMPAMFRTDIFYVIPQKPFIDIVALEGQRKVNEVSSKDNLLVINKKEELETKEDSRLLIEKGQKVFFVGDSLMQGVAPHAMRILLKQHGIESINLSKQSTGLSYPKFYNWPEVAKDTFIKNPDIKLMVVFMGPNDPWDFPVARSKRFFKFKTPEWEGVYRARIQQLINAATDHGAKVLWVGAPNVKSDKLNEGMIYLNTIYLSQVTIAKQHYTISNDVLGMFDNKFVKFMQIPNRGNVTLRTDDGTHFTTIGQKRIADKIISLLRFVDATEPLDK
ncbi:DUF459 domain-containing protein [Entomomonas moraniae]|uniref:DUF459 domain-containing protein n=1 Tax=Entomomonas moraniae TaxID=2213226 RepID=A0A3S9XG64_9GAMM|nr:SGNH family hydrolase [Entomomonas moraniae]AZS51404.1 DUF459 domain-containing protein [Entomomonas moraniae]